jgi:hypothetical protein
VKTALIDTVTSEDAINAESRSLGRSVIAIICAIAVTGMVLVGYAYLRKRHAEQTQPAAQAPVAASASKGPARAQIFVDDAMLNRGQTMIGGTVKNISDLPLANLSVALDLRRRKDGSMQQMSAPVQPSQLEPQQSGRYSLSVSSAEYGSVKLEGLKAGPDSAPISYTTLPGLRRPLERLEPKTVIVPRRAPRPGEFLNSPDNPARVP